MTTTLNDLRRANLEEMQAVEKALPLSRNGSPTPSPFSEEKPSFEETFIPSNEAMSARAEEGTKERTTARRSAPANVGTKARGKADTPARADEGWLDDVLTRAKGGADTDNDRSPTSRLNVDIADDLHMRLKMHCLNNRITLRKLLPVLLTAYLEKAGD